MLILPEDHFYMKSTQTIQELWKESLFKDTGITYFNFARIYKNGMHATLPSDPKWFKHYWDNGYGSLISDRLKEGVNLWSITGGELTKAAQEAKLLFNIDHKIDIVYDREEFYDLFGFATYANNDRIVNFYLNNLDKLHAYCSKFYAHGNKLILEALNKKHMLRFKGFDNKNLDLLANKKTISLVLRDLKLPNAGLSWRELQVCMLYIRGRSWDEISVSLGVTIETARSYLKNCKKKLGTKETSKFYDALYDIGLHKMPLDLILGLSK